LLLSSLNKKYIIIPVDSPDMEHSNGTGILFLAIVVQMQLPKTLFPFWEKAVSLNNKKSKKNYRK